MPRMTAEPAPHSRPWAARITPALRWGWSITFTHGATRVGEVARWRRTREGAERFARRYIAKQQAKELRREALTFEVS